MKKLLFVALLIVSALTFVGFKAMSDHSAAKADRLQGVYIFVNSEPVTEYDYLGTVQGHLRVSGGSQFTEVRDRLLKDLKKDYPNAEGAIFHFKTGEWDQVDAIKFKD